MAHTTIPIPGPEGQEQKHPEPQHPAPAPKPASGVDWSTGIMELARAVRENRQPRCSGRLAMHVLQVILAAEESTKKKCEIDVTPILPLA